MNTPQREYYSIATTDGQFSEVNGYLEIRENDVVVRSESAGSTINFWAPKECVVSIMRADES